jgi:hypothetical protein
MAWSMRSVEGSLVGIVIPPCIKRVSSHSES